MAANNGGPIAMQTDNDLPHVVPNLDAAALVVAVQIDVAAAGEILNAAVVDPEPVDEDEADGLDDDEEEEMEEEEEEKNELDSDAPVLGELWDACFSGDRDAILRLMTQAREEGFSIASRDIRPVKATGPPVGMCYTALHHAVAGGQLESVKLIVPHLSKLGVNTEDEMGLSALDHAIDIGALSIAKVLNQYGGSLACGGHMYMSAIHFAVNSKDPVTLYWVLSFPEMRLPVNINSRAPANGLTPLHMACDFGLGTMVKMLLAAGADANIRSSKSPCPTPFHTAFGSKHLDIDVLFTLRRAEASVNVVDEFFQNVLHYLANNSAEPVAVHWLHKKALLTPKLLEQRDWIVRPDIRCGYTPLQICFEEGAWPLASTLLLFGAELSKLEVMSSLFVPSPKCFEIITEYCLDCVAELEAHLPFDVAAIVTAYLRPTWSGHIVPRSKRRRPRDQVNLK